MDDLRTEVIMVTIFEDYLTRQSNTSITEGAEVTRSLSSQQLKRKRVLPELQSTIRLYDDCHHLADAIPK